MNALKCFTDLQGTFAVSYDAAHRHQKNGVYVEVDVLNAVMDYGQVYYVVTPVAACMATLLGHTTFLQPCY